MKKLTRIRLINWHRFIDTTVDFGSSMLISGENGSGKSTLLDAVQFVVTCSANHFNKAAHENGKRRLTGYIRCKTGKENRPYERTGELSAHVALEFYEEKTGKFFVVGSVIDSSSENQEKWVRYIINNKELEDIGFTEDGAPMSISRFRVYNKALITNWCTTDKDAKAVIRNRFGRVEDRFFNLIPKALAFKPIDDIKNFVYSYVLDEKEVNIDALRENVRTYQELEKTLESVRTRIGRLETINSYHQNVLDGQEKDKRYDYFLSRVEVEVAESRIEELSRTIEKNRIRLEDSEARLQEVNKDKLSNREMRDSIRTEMASDADFLALDEQKKRLDYLKNEEISLLPGEEKILTSVRDLNKKHRRYGSLLEEKDERIEEYDNVVSAIKSSEDLTSVREKIADATEYKQGISENLRKEGAEKGIELAKLSREKQELKHRIEKLKKKKLSYPDSVTCLMDNIRDDFASIGRKSEPKILCETLEIADESWRNAVEGYLNTQRFYILVEPEDFDIALSTYDKLRKKKRVYGAGLINTGKLEEYAEAPEGSLAAVVESADPYAKRYINMILGRVTMCDNYVELKKHPTAITRECMKYQNRVASAIKPEIFRTPYIGKNAAMVQLSQAEEKYSVLKETIDALTSTIENMEARIACLETSLDIDIMYRLETLQKLRTCRKGITACLENISTLEKNSNIMQKQLQLESIERIISELEKAAEDIAVKTGILKGEINRDSEQVKNEEESLALRKENCRNAGETAGDKLPSWEKDYEKQRSERTPEAFLTNFQSQKKRNQTQIENAIRDMEKAMVEYKTAHDFGASATLEGYQYFETEYVKLKESELLSYEEKVRSARETAEIEFREQFLSKLQENIKQAQTEFKDLNDALKDIVFSNERYEFTYGASRIHRDYYDMIMADFNAVSGESLLSGHFHEEHKEVIDELFEKLALDKENSLKSLDEFTDYRTYMDYDIKILHGDGAVSMYSKVCEEKSGGETQTPFYVTVAASFVQLYHRSIGGEAIGLVMFDEAFNNMDDDRIGGVLEFMNKLNLQIIISAPPEKIQYIGPYMDETILVMTDEKVSFIEEYKVQRQ